MVGLAGLRITIFEQGTCVPRTACLWAQQGPSEVLGTQYSLQSVFWTGLGRWQVCTTYALRKGPQGLSMMADMHAHHRWPVPASVKRPAVTHCSVFQGGPGADGYRVPRGARSCPSEATRMPSGCDSSVLLVWSEEVPLEVSANRPRKAYWVGRYPPNTTKKTHTVYENKTPLVNSNGPAACACLNCILKGCPGA